VPFNDPDAIGEDDGSERGDEDNYRPTARHPIPWRHRTRPPHPCPLSIRGPAASPQRAWCCGSIVDPRRYGKPDRRLCGAAPSWGSSRSRRPSKDYSVAGEFLLSPEVPSYFEGTAATCNTQTFRLSHRGATHATTPGHSTRDGEGAEFPGTYRFCRGGRPSRPGAEPGCEAALAQMGGAKFSLELWSRV
jgi:hypothetical protein